MRDEDEDVNLKVERIRSARSAKASKLPECIISMIWLVCGWVVAKLKLFGVVVNIAA